MALGDIILAHFVVLVGLSLSERAVTALQKYIESLQNHTQIQPGSSGSGEGEKRVLHFVVFYSH